MRARRRKRTPSPRLRDVALTTTTRSLGVRVDFSKETDRDILGLAPALPNITASLRATSNYSGGRWRENDTVTGWVMPLEHHDRIVAMPYHAS